MTSNLAAKGTTELHILNTAGMFQTRTGFQDSDKIDIGGLETKFIIGIAQEGLSNVIILDSPTEYAHLPHTLVAKIQEVPEVVAITTVPAEAVVANAGSTMPVNSEAIPGGSDGVAATAMEIARSQ